MTGESQGCGGGGVWQYNGTATPSLEFSKTPFPVNFFAACPLYTVFSRSTATQEAKMSSDSSDSDDAHPQNPPPPSAKPKKKKKHVPPQDTINKIWSRFSVKKFSKATVVLPFATSSNQTTLDPSKPPQTGRDNLLVSEDFDRAVQECRTRVKKLIKECRRVNMRYRDPDFDIDWDLKMKKGYCLNNLKDNKFVI